MLTERSRGVARRTATAAAREIYGAASAKALAEALGFSRQTVADALTGRADPSPRVAAALERARARKRRDDLRQARRRLEELESAPEKGFSRRSRKANRDQQH